MRELIAKVKRRDNASRQVRSRLVLLEKDEKMTKLCERGKRAAKKKFKVYPSAYANAYASKICAGKIKDPSGVKRKDFKGPKPVKLGGEMKKPVKKAGLGLLMAVNEIRKQGKKEGRRQAQEGQSQDKQYQEYLATKNVSEPKNMNTGDLAELTDKFEGHDVNGSSIKGEYGINSSMRNYYKDLLG